MSRLRAALLSHLLVVSAAAAQTPATLDSIDRYVRTEVTRYRIPGLSLAVLRGDSVVLARGYGYANVEHRVPATDSTGYQSGSVGKQFTAAAIVMLAEQGRLSLDDSILRFLPDGPATWRGVTIRHLLTHTSGIADYTDSTLDTRRDYTEAELVRLAAQQPLEFAPGDRWNYSNTGYVLLGIVIHRVTGVFYGDFLKDHVFRPLGMRTTRIISEADIIPNRAAGYHLVNDTLKNQDWVSPSLNTTADGALYFTVRDLAHWAIGLNHWKIPSRAGLEASWTPVRLNSGGTYPYGFRWQGTQQRGNRRIGHGGRSAAQRRTGLDVRGVRSGGGSRYLAIGHAGCADLLRQRARRRPELARHRTVRNGLARRRVRLLFILTYDDPMAAGRRSSARTRCRTRRRVGSRSRAAGAVRHSRVAARLLRRHLVGHRCSALDRYRPPPGVRRVRERCLLLSPQPLLLGEDGAALRTDQLRPGPTRGAHGPGSHGDGARVRRAGAMK